MPSGVTKQGVWKIAEALTREEQIPSVISVRSQLGGGNPHTIATHLASWRAAHIEEQSLFHTEKEVLMAAQEEMEQERAELMEEIERLDGDLEKARKELSTSTHALDVARKGAERVETQSKIQEQQLKEVREKAEKLVERNQALQIEIAALKERTVHIDALRALIEKLQGELASLARSKETAKEPTKESDAKDGMAQRPMAEQKATAPENATGAGSSSAGPVTTPSRPPATPMASGQTPKGTQTKEGEEAQKKTPAITAPPKPSSPPSPAFGKSERPGTIRK
uniref:Replication region DNA-binding N-term n=1 Tax=Candidatus Kentrum sp. DK TaxID=2126562 RepID=A0A450TBY5_9GAMM|nr:MAG: replication region DNA-binding N-term [Candidatus Kentron sp. DK]VFJ64305.1 MAG: replication region DNA-binding N-term [Candidatus Kentron sp. DK]